jgi:prepilin-type processing-associated H-X9-DG protein
MTIYASQNNGSIPGSAWTSARLLYRDPESAALAPGINNANCPSVIQIWDWATPIARIMGIKFEEGALQPERARRFLQMRDYPGFVCPENEFLSPLFGGITPPSLVPTGRLVSYNTAMGFLLRRQNPGANSNAQGRTLARLDQNPPASYNVKVSKVGSASRKIYIADGARFSNTLEGPDADLSIAGQNGGAFSDQGAGMRFSQSWDRGLAAGNLPRVAGNRDARVFAYRHGQTIQRGRGDTYRFNAGFFDGHVETLGDLQGADPSMWFPKGTELVIDSVQVYGDVKKKYFDDRNFALQNPFIVP